MIAPLLRFEMRYHFRQIVFQAAAALFFGLGIIMPLGSFGGPQINKNGPYVINFIICLLSIFIIFVSTLLCAGGVLRDQSHQTDALIFSTRVGKPVYFGVKLLGLVLAVFFIISIAAIGILVGSELLAANPKGSFQPRYYLQPLLLFGLPNALFCSCLIFAAAIVTQKVSAVYVAGVLVFILYMAASILGNSPLLATSALKAGGPGLWSVLADPFGLTTFFSELKGWSVWRRNHDLYPLRGLFLANRLLWTGISLVVILLAYRRFTFTSSSIRPVGKPGSITAASKKETYKPVSVQAKGDAYYLSALGSQIRQELAFLFRQQLFLALLALWLFLYLVELNENVFHGPYQVSFYATTALVIEQLLPMRMALLLLVFFTSQLIHRESATGMQALVFSTPVPNAVMFLAKTGSLLALIVVLISSNIVTGIGFQLMAGNQQPDLVAYLSLFYYSGLQLALFSVLIVFIQTVISNKYLSMLLSLFVLGVCLFGKMLGIEPYILRFASAPELVYSVINGFGHYGKSFNGYMLYWTSVALLIGLLTVSWWQDGRHDTWASRMSAGLRGCGSPSKAAILSALLLMSCTGFYIIEKSSGIALGSDSETDIQWQKGYEQKYKPDAGLPQPVITAVKINTDIFPDQKRYVVRGQYMLKNESASAISKLWVSADPTVTVEELRCQEGYPTSFDKVFNQYFYQLKKPILPGAELSLCFSLTVERSGYLSFNSENSVVDNGSYIELEKFLPLLGYNQRFEIDDPQTRKKCGLRAHQMPAATDYRYHLIDFENTVSTNADQRVVTVGRLEKTWGKGRRNYFLYKSSQPIAFMFAVSSMRYAVCQETENGITYQIFHQPGQTQNLPAMMQAMKDAIRYGNKNFSQYPFAEMTLAEIPAYPGAATAYPGVIFSSEKYNFLTNASDTSRLNFIYATTAHETAHQWWANKISPRNGVGQALLTESLAKYTEAMVCEKRMGKTKLHQYLRTDNQLYFNLRNTSAGKELPLSRTWEQPFVHYQKGGLAMYAIRESLGEERVNRALKRLIASRSFPYLRPSPENLISVLKADATRPEQVLIENQLERVVIYDNRVKILSFKAISDDRFKLRLLVSVQKTDETNQKSVKMKVDDWIDIGMFQVQEPSWTQPGKPIYLKKHHIKADQTVIEMIVDKKPKVVAIDPYGYLLDGDLENNKADL